MSERADTRADRLKAALRENLKRRKGQVRGRSSSNKDGSVILNESDDGRILDDNFDAKKSDQF